MGKRHLIHLHVSVIFSLCIFLGSSAWAESKPSSSAGDQKIFDKVTEINFNAPKGVTVTHYDWGYCPTDKPSVEPPQELSWYVHTRDFEKGDFKSRIARFTENLAVADGMDGGTNGKGTLIRKFETASKDQALLFEVRIETRIGDKRELGQVGCYILAVELRKAEDNKSRTLVITSYYKDILIKVANTIDIPNREQP